MRLLKLVGSDEFELVEVPTHNTIPYAILSHTWIHGQEVTYQELISGGGKSKTGYEKLRFCGEQANKDGFLYFWVDTCCINKLDPFELATAINSMFRWYQNAKKCYVYLADVSIGGCDGDKPTNQSGWDAAFRGSRWFTRGWTLQELIAPAIVEFFSRDCKLLGDKTSLESLIHEITRIPIKALQGNPSDFNIEERKAWAAQRQTTEQEDIVYCLIGLCEVSMPLLYGEGRETAMKRLDVAIEDLSPDINERNIHKDGEVAFIVPFERNHRFTGRQSQLATVEKAIAQQGQTTKLAIRGLGGVGKTQLVLELIYRTRDKNKNCLVIWIPATNMESLEQAYLEVARQLCIPGWQEDKTQVKSLVQKYLSEDSRGQWLLVFDNADDIDMWIPKAGSEQKSNYLTGYLPRSKIGSIIFTTRDRRLAVKLAQNNVIDVPELDDVVAKDLLQKCLVNPDLVSDTRDTELLLDELTYLPLAIVQAAAYINENGIAISDYLSLLKDQEEVIDLLSEDFQDEGRYRNVKNPVATTWLISFEQIRQCDPLAADYLSFMACIDSKDIPLSLLPASLSQKKMMDAIGTLDSYSFITKRSRDQALDLHRLVHLATRSWLQQQGEIAQRTERAITRLEEVFPDDDYQNRIMWRTYLPHVRYALAAKVLEKSSSSRTELVRRFGMCLYQDGRFIEAESQFLEVLETLKRVKGQEHPETLTGMANLASIYIKQGRWKEAEDLGLLVVETRKRVLGEEHLDTLTSINDLAATYQNQGRWKEAEYLAVPVIEAQKRVLGQEHPYTLISIGNLASIYGEQGRGKQAEDLQVLVVEIMTRVLGREHLDTLTSMNNLAFTYWKQDRWKEAEDLGVLVMEKRQRLLGQEHPDTLRSMYNLALTWNSQGKGKEALVLMEKCLELRTRGLGEDHPSTQSSRKYIDMWREELGLEPPQT